MSASTTTEEISIISRLAAPIALAQLGLVGMSLVDTAILGHAGPTELAGGSLGRNIAFACGTLQIGLALAMEPLASQAVGAGDFGRARSALRATLRTLALFWLPTAALALLAALLLEALGTEHSVALRARWFILGQVPAILFQGAFLASKSYLQAHGKTFSIVLASAVANVVNIVVCNVLVRGDDALAAVHLAPRGLPKLGAFGAGLSVSIGGLVLTSIVLGSAWALKRGDSHAAKKVVSTREVLKYGMPVGLHMAAEVGVFAFVSVLTGRLGASVVAAHQVALGLASFTFMGALGVSGATAARVGQAVGAGRPSRVPGLVGMGLGMVVMSLGAAAFIGAPYALVSMFTDDEGVRSLGVSLLHIAALFQLFDGVQAVAGGALRGRGDVRFSFVAGVCSYWLIGFPIAVILAFPMGLGVVGLWIGLTAGLVAAAIALASRFLWLTRGDRVTTALARA
jgi:MATE family multidrug resistance protein